MLDSIKSNPEKKPIQEPRLDHKKSHRLRNWIIITLIVLAAIGAILAGRAYSLAQRILEKSPGAMSFGELFLASDQPLIGEEHGEVRILLMGIGGENHDGGTLTDTLILATLKTPNEENEELRIGLVSFPRDLVVDIPGYDFRRINSAYAFAEIAEEGSGPIAATETVEKIIGKEIPYFAVIDFTGFEEIINKLGGLEIEVKQGFTDSRFPDNNDGYLEPITFEEGQQKFDGKRTLQYVRSRHGNNGQGSDFARSERQQQVIKAIAQKVSRLNIFFNLGLINDILNDLADNFLTNLELHEMKRLYDLGKNFKSSNISSTSIGSEFGILCDEIIEDTGAYVLVPCRGLTDYSQIEELIENQFDPKKFIELDEAHVEIQNASAVPGLALQTKAEIEAEQLQITTSNLRSEAIYNEGVIYDNTGGAKPNTLEYLQRSLNLRIAQSPFPFPTSADNPDFVIVVINQ